jgi:hypothetical protein
MLICSIGDLAICCIFGAWLLCCILNQISRERNVFRLWDPLGLIPCWRLFAPRPLRLDYRILYRTLDIHDRFSAWQVTGLPPERPSWAGIWHPQARTRKIVIETVQQLPSFFTPPRDCELFMGTHYYCLMSHLIASTKCESAVALQFAVVSYRRFDEGFTQSLIFCSPVQSIQ